MSIGDNIRNIRKQKGLTQAELGKRLDCTQQLSIINYSIVNNK